MTKVANQNVYVSGRTEWKQEEAQSVGEWVVIDNPAREVANRPRGLGDRVYDPSKRVRDVRPAVPRKPFTHTLIFLN